MFSQLRSVVASAVTQDPIYQYKVDEKSARLLGRNEIFRVKDAVEVSSGKEVSIFQVKVADLVARQDPAIDATFFLDRVRHHVAFMSQLRHPGVLRIERGLVDVPGKKVWFVTERVTAWVPHLPLKEMPRQLKVLGLRRCAETLRFMHETADLMLVDFSPQALYVTSDGRWKIGDFIHAIRRTEMMAESDAGVVSVLCSPSHSFRSVSAPLLDYVAAEFVDFVMKGGGGAGAPQHQQHQQQQQQKLKGPSLAELMGGGATGGIDGSQQTLPQQQQQQGINLAAPLGFPDSDIYSFLLAAVEILNGGDRLFNCAGSLERHKAMRGGVEKEVERYFPRGALSYRPRPPMSTVMETGPFATHDMRLLDQIERYDTLDPNERFALFKVLYTSLGPSTSTSTSSTGGGGGGLNDNFSLADITRGKAERAEDGSCAFCEPVIVENILPLLKRESKQQSMLRFVLPIMLQCCRALSAKAFEEHLREYFTALLGAMTNAKSPWYEKVGMLAQLVLEKFDTLAQKMNTTSDKTNILMPFLVKCLYTDANGDDEALLSHTLSAMRRLFEAGGDAAVATLLPTNDAAAALAGRLTDIGSTHPTLFTSAFLCLERILLVASTATKEAAETHLIQALKRRSASDESSSSGGGSPSPLSATTSSESRRMQLQSMMTTLQKLEDGFSREHAAAKSIPQLAPLLLCGNNTVRAFVVQCIDKHLGSFRAISSDGGAYSFLGGNGSGVPVPSAVAKPSTRTAMDFFSAPSAAAAGFTTATTTATTASTSNQNGRSNAWPASANHGPSAAAPAASTTSNAIWFAPPPSAPAPSPAGYSSSTNATTTTNNNNTGIVSDLFANAGTGPMAYSGSGGGAPRRQNDDDIFASLGFP